jgi:hypothetical protein
MGGVDLARHERGVRGARPRHQPRITANAIEQIRISEADTDERSLRVQPLRGHIRLNARQRGGGRRSGLAGCPGRRQRLDLNVVWA